ncbi:MAG: adenosylmethionine decarboxylase [Oligoflexales bacterium]
MLPIGDQHMFHGVHVLGELYEVDSKLLQDENLLESCLREGIEQSGASLCGIQTKKFDEGGGVTILALLSESHASIHTYPEKGALFFDAFTCGTRCQTQRIADALVKALKPGRTELQSIQRGETPESHSQAQKLVQTQGLEC